MNELDISFEDAPWEMLLNDLRPGAKVSAANLLVLLEDEGEDAVEDAFLTMETRNLELDVSDLPRVKAAGETTARLLQEMEMSKTGIAADQLEPNDPLRLYLEEVAATPAFGDEQVLAREAAGGDSRAQEQLTNLGLSRVLELARTFTGYGIFLLDLIQEGSLGLWKAVSGYTGGIYSQQRDHWIRFYMAKAVALQARANGVGQKARQGMEDYRQVDERLLSELGRNPTLEEIAWQMHISQEEAESLRKMVDDARLMAQMKQPEEPEEKEQDQAVEDTAAFQSRARILDLLSGLDEKQARLLTLRFGLEGKPPLTPEETGKRLGLSAQEVVRQEAEALAKLRRKQAD